jgi:hypothetical protein
LRVNACQQLPAATRCPNSAGRYQFAAHLKQMIPRAAPAYSPDTFRSAPDTVNNLTERKGSCGVSVFEHATKVVTTAASAHKRKTRPAASEIEDMEILGNNTDQPVSNLFKIAAAVKRQ